MISISARVAINTEGIVAVIIDDLVPTGHFGAITIMGQTATDLIRG